MNMNRTVIAPTEDGRYNVTVTLADGRSWSLEDTDFATAIEFSHDRLRATNRRHGRIF
jgi:hypothetical protein